MLLNINVSPKKTISERYNKHLILIRLHSHKPYREKNNGADQANTISYIECLQHIPRWMKISEKIHVHVYQNQSLIKASREKS